MKEVQAAPDGYLDLWAREHYKSTIVTFALTIQTILANPEETICIFSHTRPNARKFLRQIKQEFETNARLRDSFPTCCGRTRAASRPSGRRTMG